MNYKSIFNIIKNYHWRSLFFRYWKILIIAFAVPMIIFFVLFFKLYNSSQQSEFNQTFIASAMKSRSEFDLVANNIENYYNSAVKDRYVLKFLDSSAPEPVDIDNYDTFTTIVNQFNTFKANNSYVDSVFLYSKKSDYVISTHGSNYRENFQYRNIVNKYLDNAQHVYVSTIDSDTVQSTQCLTVVYALCPNNYNHADGFLFVNIDSSKLSEHVSSNNIYEDILMFTNNGFFLDSTVKEPDNDIETYTNIYKTNLDKINTSDYFIERTKNSILCYVPIKSLDITMALNMSSKNQKNIINSFALSVSILLIIIILVIILISFYTSLIIYKSIANIISEIGIAPLSDDSNTNEANFISNHFLSTLEKKSDIENELTKKVQLLKKSQTLALQTQINPHFIFNTLNLVNLMIIRITQENCAPAQIISLLSDIMYYSLKTDRFIVTLDEEISYAKKYIQIEQIKYNNKFDFEFVIDESIKDCKTVKFSLQPILENCVEHGIKKLKDRKGIIKLKAFRDENTLHLTITDNGIGITPQKLDILNVRLNSDEIPDGKHIGLVNVNQRIHLIFGKEYGIKVIPLTQGLTIELTQPAKIEL